MNELLLLASIPIYFGLLIAVYRLFGKTGLYIWTALAAVMQNIEVLALVDAFGMEMTLGNVLFSSTFLLTDILSECYGRKEADRAVGVGFVSTLLFIVFSQLWLRFVPSAGDYVMPAMRTIFGLTPRVALASLVVYLIVQKIDIVLYHYIWEKTATKSGDRSRFLWLRNNLATNISQIINSVLFTLLAFGGLYDFSTLISIMLSSYAVFFVVSILDTPFLYLARRIRPNEI